MPQKKKNIITIIFDIDSNRRYSKLKAIEKIQLIKNRIHDVCKILKTQNPNDTWIVVWREYGIFERNSNSISNKIKKQLKKEMINISKRYPHLIIIAGTVLTCKKKPVAYLNNVKQYYKKLDWIKKLEEKCSDKQMHQHINKIETVSKKAKNDNASTIRVTSNKARVYFHGKEKRHGKTAPFSENSYIPDAIYQPGKNNNFDPVITIDEYPLDISIGIEICREHADVIHYLKYMVEDKKISQKPLLHFIISNTISLDRKNLCAKLGAIHVDSEEPPRLVLSQDFENQNATIKLYHCKVMEPIQNLIDFIEPEYPVQHKMQQTINDSKKLTWINNYPLTENIKKFLNNFFPSPIKMMMNGFDSGKKSRYQPNQIEKMRFFTDKNNKRKLDEYASSADQIIVKKIKNQP